MSWKDVKIGKKLYIGFGVVLVLCAAIGLVSYNGLGTVAAKGENADDANRLIKWTKDIRQAEKNYIMRDDDKYVEQLHEIAEKVAQQIVETKARFEDQADVDAIEKVDGHMNTYLAAFDKWVSLHKEALQNNEIIVANGRKCEKECENLRASQKEQLEQELADRVSHQKIADRTAKADDANRLIKYVLQIRRAEKNWLLRRDNQYAEQNLSMVADLKTQCLDTKAKMNQKANRDQMDAVLASAEEYEKAFNQYVAIDKEQGEVEENMVAAARSTVELCDKLRQGQKAQMDSAQSSATTMAFGFAIGAILLGIFVAFIIARGISKPVSQMAGIANQIAVGDVDHTIELESKDEIGMLAGSFRKLIDYMKDLAGVAEQIADNNLTVQVQPKSEKDVLGNSFKTMVTNLTGVIRELKDNATQLVSAATEVASASEEMSRGAQEQTGQTDQVSSAVEEMTATIVEASKNAGEASAQAKEAADAANDGTNVVSQTIEGMNRIANVVQESANTIQKLAKSSDQIGEIIGVIDDIADQTNLLALNAAIEAARAGEQGRGFAVVADEVRKLAERTIKATKEITGMIKGIQDDTKGAVTSMEQGINEVQAGKELTDKAGNSLNSIAQFSQRVMDMIQQIATASEEQSAASEQISKNVENIASVTKQTATGAEQSAAAAEELNRQAEGLQTMVARFKVETGKQEEVRS